MNQLDMLRKHFDSGRSLTVLTALDKYGIYALSQRCGELERGNKRLGREPYPLERNWVSLPSGKKVLSYRRASRDLLSRVRAACFTIMERQSAAPMKANLPLLGSTQWFPMLTLHACR